MASLAGSLLGRESKSPVGHALGKAGSKSGLVNGVS
jgi:hypothetical protein